MRGNNKFEGKIVLITGASSGIGRQVAFDFASAGAMVIILVARTESKLAELENIIRGKKDVEQVNVVSYCCDVSNKQQVSELAQKVIGRFGYVDILVNNAGIGIYGRLEDQTAEDLELVMRTNYLGTAYLTKALLGPMLKRRSGHIVNIASVAGSFGVAGLAGYSASKYAVLGFSESLYHELHDSGVQITVVSPIGVKTNFFNHPSFGMKPNFAGFFLEPDVVSKAILKASCSSRLEIIVPFYVRGGVWLKETFPYLLNPLIGWLFRRQLNKTKKAIR
ncbi:MAG TPA: SDR family NAD(P)-dependent oxidoreductase [Nitrososphaeraceae archaeon]|jgi:short-subunit dehydrogenase|nr:SDR family NAD(P)-dependent oxidoreductase [Nitrososphaeraceae archaeon]